MRRFLKSYFNSGRIRTVRKGETRLIKGKKLFRNKNVIPTFAKKELMKLKVLDCDRSEGWVGDQTTIKFQILYEQLSS